VTAHDGFTLADLVSYHDKHNEANGEDNRDGENHNISFNHGTEGPTSNRTIIEARARQQRNFLTTLMISIGVPMISGGDELGRTQAGNNNAYCQDNETSWTHWDIGPREREMLAFTRKVLQVWTENPVLRRRKFLQGHQPHYAGGADITWLQPSGEEMSAELWQAPGVRALGMRLNGEAIDEADDRGRRVVGDTLLVLFNASDSVETFVLPDADPVQRWESLIETADPWRPARRLRAGDGYELPARSMAVMRLAGKSNGRPAPDDWGPAGTH
jgi:isoamylase